MKQLILFLFLSVMFVGCKKDKSVPNKNPIVKVVATGDHFGFSILEQVYKGLNGGIPIYETGQRFEVKAHDGDFSQSFTTISKSRIDVHFETIEVNGIKSPIIVKVFYKDKQVYEKEGLEIHGFVTLEE